MTAQGVANMVWAFATCGQHHALLFDAMAERVRDLDVWAALNPQAIANMLWAYAKLGNNHTYLLVAMGQRMLCPDNVLAKFNGQLSSVKESCYRPGGRK